MKRVHLVLGLSLVLCGCGDGGSGLSCLSGFTPCGGSVVGTWELESSCGDPARTDECQAQAVSYHPGYTITFNADGTYSIPPVHYTATWATPASCYAGPSGASDCASKGLKLPAGPGNGCSLSTDGSCACSATVSSPVNAVAIQGTYTVSGTHLTVTSSPGSSSTNAYCVQGNRMAQAQVDGDQTRPGAVVWARR